MTKIVCRSKSSKKCVDGLPTAVEFGEDGPLSEDGTFMVGPKFPAGSICCNCCYIAIGMPLNPVLPGKA